MCEARMSSKCRYHFNMSCGHRSKKTFLRCFLPLLTAAAAALTTTATAMKMTMKEITTSTTTATYS